MMLAQAFVEQVAASERKLIAVVSSKMGSIEDNGSGGSYIYRSSKTMVNQVVKCLSVDLAPREISVFRYSGIALRTPPFEGSPNP